MILAVLPMVELVEVAEGVHDGLEDRFQEKGVAIYTISIHKKIVKVAQILLPIAAPSRKCVNQTSFCPPLFNANTQNGKISLLIFMHFSKFLFIRVV